MHGANVFVGTGLVESGGKAVKATAAPKVQIEASIKHSIPHWTSGSAMDDN
jgi:hypothetical protein